jgi:serine/threonine-protein kinase HipA
VEGDRTLWVYVEWRGTLQAVGVLQAHVQGDREHATFEPRDEWLDRPEAALCAPMMGLPPGPQTTGASMPLFGALGDSAPDRWGRTLMRRFERRTAQREKRAPRILREADFVLGVNDEIRVGALRFAEREGGPFLGRSPKPLPRTAALARLLEAVQAYEQECETLPQAKLLLQTGQLLGGSRPKASVRAEDGTLLVAKFPSRGDDRDMQRWEALVLGLAADCGIAVPRHSVARVAGQSVLLLERFDREGDRRIPVVSTFGLLGAQDNQAGSYAAIARVIRAIGGRPRDDVRELWRRALFAVLVTDKDNHLRNHGLMLCETGWRLCPAYDLNAEAEARKPREMLLSIDGIDPSASLAIALEAAPQFGWEASEARVEARRMAEVIRTWEARAHAARLPAREIKAMRGAFEHPSMEDALRTRG